MPTFFPEIWTENWTYVDHVYFGVMIVLHETFSIIRDVHIFNILK